MTVIISQEHNTIKKDDTEHTSVPNIVEQPIIPNI